MRVCCGSRAGGALIFGVVLALLAVLAVGIALSSRRAQERRVTAQARARAELWSEAEAYRKRRPDDRDGALALYQTVAERLAGTPFEERAQRVIEELRLERVQAVESAWRELEGAVARLTEQRDFVAAAAVLDGYDGVYGAELAQRIGAAAERVRGAAAQDEERRAVLRDAAGERQRETLARAAGALFDGESARAVSVLRATLEEAAMPVDRDTLASVLELVAPLQRADEVILASFAAESEEIDLTIAGQPHRVLFAEVRDGRLRLRQRRTVGWVTADVALDMLDIGERRRRLAAGAGAGVADVWAGIQYLRAGNFDQASAALAGGGPRLLSRRPRPFPVTRLRLTSPAPPPPGCRADRIVRAERRVRVSGSSTCNRASVGLKCWGEVQVRSVSALKRTLNRFHYHPIDSVDYFRAEARRRCVISAS